MNLRFQFGVGADSPAAQRQVVVRLKEDEPTMRALAALAISSGVECKRSPFGRLMRSDRIEYVEPLFPDGSALRSSTSESRVVAAGSEQDEELAGLNVMCFRTPEEAGEAVAELNSDPVVEYAHVVQERFLARPRGPAPGAEAPVRRRRKPRPKSPRTSDPDDPAVNRQWGHRAIELFQAKRSPGFRDATDIAIAVIDTGVDASHPDLKDVVADARSFTTGSPGDIKGHGTHVIGIIAAACNNQVGLGGVCGSRKIMSLKALGPYDGPGYYRAIRDATDQGARVLNLSLGGPGQDPTEELLIKRALKKGVIVVAAMGNGHPRNNDTNYPAALDGVIAVGASTEVDRRAAFSQTGKHITLVAPGVNILSTVPTYPSELSLTTDYDAWQGTSMATPFVSAAVALLLAQRPDATRARIIRALAAGADKVARQTRFSEEYGHGRLNIRRTLARI